MKTTLYLGLSLSLSLSLAACEQDASLGRTLPPLAPGHLELSWSQTIGGLEPDTASGVAITGDGDVVVIGSSWGAPDLAAGSATVPATLIDPLTADTPQTGYITKRSGVDGSYVWGVPTETGLQSYVTRVVVDAAGDVYATGYVIHGWDVNERPTAQDAFVVKYAAAGALVWKRSLGASSLAEAYGLAVGADGAVIISGVFRGTIDFGAGPISCADAPPATDYQSSSGDAFIAQLDASGTWQWAHVFQAPGAQVIGRLAISHDGEIVAAGYSNLGEVAFGGDVLTPSDARAVVIARYTMAGDHVWSRALGPIQADNLFVYALESDLADHVAVLGREQGNPEDLLSIQVIDDAGDLVDAIANPHPALASVTTAANGMIVTTSNSPGPRSFDVGTGVLEGDALVGVFEQPGAVLGASAFVSGQVPLSPPSLNLSAAVATPDHVVVVGDFDYSVDLGLGLHWAHGSGPVDATGTAFTNNGRDALVARFDWVTD